MAAQSEVPSFYGCTSVLQNENKKVIGKRNMFTTFLIPIEKKHHVRQGLRFVKPIGLRHLGILDGISYRCLHLVP